MVSTAPLYAAKSLCDAAGRMRYSHDWRFSWRGAVNAVPESFSAYRPYGGFCGELVAMGNAPSMASDL